MSNADISHPTLKQSTKVFTRIGLMSFGGPAAQIALMHKELVDGNHWLTEQQFINALSFCMLLPGPEAMQLATYAGWRLHGVRGGLIAGLLFVIPGALVILSLAVAYATIGDVPRVNALFMGIKAAVVIIVIEALIRVSKKALNGWLHWIISAGSFIGIFFFALPFPLIIATAGLIGYLTSRTNHPPTKRPEDLSFSRSSLQSSLRRIAFWVALWWAPIAILWASGATFLTQIGLFFAKLSVVTFGGAYAVLAYMTQAAVTTHGWLSTDQMMDGLGLAETTPGPLILVTEFVGFIAGFGEQGIALGVGAALLTLWVTFVPCFLWIFTGAPYIEWISAQPRLRGALSAITAAVVGVILNLSIWFALHVFFLKINALHIGPLTVLLPEWTSLDWRVVFLAGLSGLLLLRLHWDLLKVLAVVALSALIMMNL